MKLFSNKKDNNSNRDAKKSRAKAQSLALFSPENK